MAFCSAALEDSDEPLLNPRPRNRQSEFRNEPLSLSLSSDGKMPAFGAETKVNVWQLSPKIKRIFKNDESTTGVIFVDFVPNSRNIITIEPIYERPRVKICDLDTGRVAFVSTFENQRVPVSVACSPNGKIFAVAFVDGELMVCDAMRAQELKTHRTPSHQIYSAKFSPDGVYLAVTDCEEMSSNFDSILHCQ